RTCAAPQTIDWRTTAEMIASAAAADRIGRLTSVLLGLQYPDAHDIENDCGGRADHHRDPHRPGRPDSRHRAIGTYDGAVRADRHRGRPLETVTDQSARAGE